MGSGVHTVRRLEVSDDVRGRGPQIKLFTKFDVSRFFELRKRKVYGPEMDFFLTNLVSSLYFSRVNLYVTRGIR